MSTWLLVSSSTNFASGMPAAMMRPWSNGTIMSPRGCRTSVGAFTSFMRSLTSMMPVASRILRSDLAGRGAALQFAEPAHLLLTRLRYQQLGKHAPEGRGFDSPAKTHELGQRAAHAQRVGPASSPASRIAAVDHEVAHAIRDGARHIRWRCAAPCEMPSSANRSRPAESAMSSRSATWVANEMSVSLRRSESPCRGYRSDTDDGGRTRRRTSAAMPGSSSRTRGD